MTWLYLRGAEVLLLRGMKETRDIRAGKIKSLGADRSLCSVMAGDAAVPRTTRQATLAKQMRLRFAKQHQSKNHNIQQLSTAPYPLLPPASNPSPPAMLISLTVGKVDAGLAILLTDEKRMVRSHPRASRSPVGHGLTPNSPSPPD